MTWRVKVWPTEQTWAYRIEDEANRVLREGDYEGRDDTIFAAGRATQAEIASRTLSESRPEIIKDFAADELRRSAETPLRKESHGSPQ